MLDTNALSAWAAADRRLLQVLPADRLWHLPIVALGEFLFGLRRSRERAKLERWIAEVKSTCVLVSVDAGTAEVYAEIRAELRAAGTPVPENDIWIGALSRQHQLAIASRDAHFDKITGLTRVGW